MKLIFNFVLFACIWITQSHALTVSDEVDVVQASEFIYNPADDYVPDGTFSIISQGETIRWILPLWDRKHGGIVHLLTEGQLDHPTQSKIWIKKRSQLFENAKIQDGSLWIVNTYIDKTGILAFVHAESVDGSGRPDSSGKTRIGLAWSANGGGSFQYLGAIITPFGDPNPHNVQGGVYIIRNGYFYVYYHDTRGITVARAPVDEVLSAARDGKTSSWKKYFGADLGFTSSGMGGGSYPIGVRGASHNDAACSTYNNKCYLVLTMMTWGGMESSITLYESTDGIQWDKVKIIAVGPRSSGVRGYHYAAIVNPNGNTSVGKQFYIYSAKNHLDSDRRYVRWLVNLDK